MPESQAARRARLEASSLLHAPPILMTDTLSVDGWPSACCREHGWYWSVVRFLGAGL